MYDIELGYRKFKGLIKWVARKYAILGNFRLSRQDLEAEGYLVLVKCCRAKPNLPATSFERYFKRSLYNNLQTLFKAEFRGKRKGITVDLVQAFGVPHLVPDSRIRLAEKIESLKFHLSHQAYLFLCQLAEPDEQVIEYAWRDFCRRNKLHSQGQNVLGYDKFRIRPRHIRGVFGWTPADCKRSLAEIREVYHKT